MLSSTSNSNVLGPRGPWRKVWTVGLLLALMMLGGLELSFRYLGQEPTIVSSAALWSYHRERARHAGPNTIALLGASRMQLGFVPEAFLEVHPSFSLVQLAVAGDGPFAALRDLAHDETFRGLVICSVAARMLQPSRWEDQQKFVEYFDKKWGPGEQISLLLSVALQERLLILGPRLGARQIFGAHTAGQVRQVNYVQTRFDRTRIADYGLIDVEPIIERRVARIRKRLSELPPVSEDSWREVVDHLAGLVKKIEARGGKVVFVKFPARGRMQALADEFFPRAEYWDTFVASVGTVAIHHEELPGVADLSCPDESHLDYPGAIVFTKALAHELAARGIIR